MLIEYLKAMNSLPMPVPKGFRYKSIYDLVLHEGRSFRAAPLSVEQRSYMREVIQRDGGRYPWQQCFSTSQRIVSLADPDKRLDYYEGVAVSHMIPVHHGWLVLDGEKVIDLTWRTHKETNSKRPLELTRVFGNFPEAWEYRGLAVATREEIRSRALDTREWASFLDNIRHIHPLYKKHLEHLSEGAANDA